MVGIQLTVMLLRKATAGNQAQLHLWKVKGRENSCGKKAF